MVYPLTWLRLRREVYYHGVDTVGRRMENAVAGSGGRKAAVVPMNRWSIMLDTRESMVNKG